VAIGVAAGRESMKVPLDLERVFQSGRNKNISLDFLYLFSELRRKPIALDLGRLVWLVSEGRLLPISVSKPIGVR